MSSNVMKKIIAKNTPKNIANENSNNMISPIPIIGKPKTSKPKTSKPKTIKTSKPKYDAFTLEVSNMFKSYITKFIRENDPGNKDLIKAWKKKSSDTDDLVNEMFEIYDSNFSDDSDESCESDCDDCCIDSCEDSDTSEDYEESDNSEESDSDEESESTNNSDDD